MVITYRTLHNIQFPVFLLYSNEWEYADGLLFVEGQVIDDTNMPGSTMGIRRLQTPQPDLYPLKKAIQNHNGILKQTTKCFIDNNGKPFIYQKTKFANLKYLKINNTSIPDNGLLSVSPSVESLNLNNTDISFEGLKQLLQNNELKNVYLWNTNLNNENQQMLTDLYSVNLNFGVSDFAKGVPLSSPEPISEQTMFSDSIKIEFYKPLGDPTIRYTINGEDPDSLSTIYTNPFFISSTINLKAKAFKKGWLDSKIGTVDFVKVEGILKDYVLKTAPDNRYKNPKKLFDGIVGDINFRDGHWNGFIRTQDYKKGVNERNSGDLVLEIDLNGKGCLPS